MRFSWIGHLGETFPSWVRVTHILWFCSYFAMGLILTFLLRIGPLWCFAGGNRVMFRCDKDESHLKWKMVLLPFGLVTAFAERVYIGIMFTHCWDCCFIPQRYETVKYLIPAVPSRMHGFLCIPVPSWTRWRHRMETVSASLGLCAENPSVTGEFPSQRSVTRSFDVFFDLPLNKRLSKQSWCL